MRCPTAAVSAMAMMVVTWMLGCSESPSEPAKSSSPDAAVASPVAEVGLLKNDPRAFQGYTLFSPLVSHTTYLVDMEGRVVHTWECGRRPALGAYLLENGRLLRAGTKHSIRRGPTPDPWGGRVQEFTWDGELVWDFTFGDDQTSFAHHDIQRMPNGNVLMIVMEKKNAAVAVAAGRNPLWQAGAPLCVDAIVEVKPTGKTTGRIVWEWHAWDHLIQDFDPTKANYGDVAAHSERIDLNYQRGWVHRRSKKEVAKLHSLGYLRAPTWKQRQRGSGASYAELTHLNAVAYNAELDQIVVSGLVFDELWIIDHSTTTAEAAGHTGGRWGKGGDLLYRWGNPRAYRAGTLADQQFRAHHDAHWIPPGLRGEGHLLVFNNGSGRPDGSYSSVDEIVPSLDKKGRYVLKPGMPCGPPKPTRSYTAPNKTDFYAMHLSGAQRLPGGNTLICAGSDGTIFEVTPGGDVVWKYVNPEGARPSRGTPPGRAAAEWGTNQIFRAYRYAPDYPGLAGRDLTPGKTIQELLAAHAGGQRAGR
jgi:arylsulfotransferase ASST